MNLNKKTKELLMYCALAFVAGYLMCMYYPVHTNTNGYSLGGILEGVENESTNRPNNSRNNNNNNNNNNHNHNKNSPK